MDNTSGSRRSAMLLVALALLAGAFWYAAEPDIKSTGQNAAPVLPKQSVPLGMPEERGPLLASPFGPHAPGTETTGLSGHWIGQLDTGDASPAQVSFKLQAAGAQLSGTATFPVGEGSIENGKVTGNQLSFSTRHRLPSSSQILITRFTGDIGNGMIALRMQTEGGESQLNIHQISR